jgi:hypothetical protein
MKHAAQLFMVFSLVAGLSNLNSANADEPNSKFTFKKTTAGVLISEGDSPILFYQKQTKSKDGKWARANYVHPLYDLDGRVITEDFPADHGHHRGVFWAWHQVLIDGKQIGDAWECKKFQWDVRDVKLKREDNSVELAAEVYWLSPDWPGEGQTSTPFVKEQTSIRVHRASGDHRFIDFTIRIEALVPNLKLGGSNNVKGYGGFSPRIRLNKTMKFVGEKGEIEPIRTAIDAGPWVDVSGDFREPNATAIQTDDDSRLRVSGMTMLSHRSIPGFPRPWILRRASSMQNPVFPGRVPVEVPVGKPLVLKYRLVLHRGPAETAKITAWQNAF